VAVTAEFDGADDGAGGLRVRLDEPARGIAPGQAVVLYEGTRVVGSATIDGTTRRDEEQAVAAS
jgi:tRNA-specific 2-thiouridylase